MRQACTKFLTTESFFFFFIILHFSNNCNNFPALLTDKIFFSSPITSTLTLAPTQRPIQWTLGYFLGVKRRGREVNHSPPCNVGDKNEWSYTCTPPHMPSRRGRGKNFLFFPSLISGVMRFKSAWSLSRKQSAKRTRMQQYGITAVSGDCGQKHFRHCSIVERVACHLCGTSFSDNHRSEYQTQLRLFLSCCISFNPSVETRTLLTLLPHGHQHHSLEHNNTLDVISNKCTQGAQSWDRI